MSGTGVEPAEEEAEKEREEACRATTREPESGLCQDRLFLARNSVSRFCFSQRPSFVCGRKGALEKWRLVCHVVSFILSALWPREGTLHHFCLCSLEELGEPPLHLSVGVEPFPFVSQNTHLWRAPSWERVCLPFSLCFSEYAVICGGHHTGAGVSLPF